MSKYYAVRFRGIDGGGSVRFSSLKAAAKFVRDRYLGSEYVRGENILQAEFGYFTFTGFGWSDLGAKVFDEDGCPEFRWYEQFGGNLDPLLDPTKPGDYRICEVHPQWHPSFDYCTGVQYKLVCRAATAAEARAKEKRLYDKAGDTLDGLEFTPWVIRYKDKEVWLNHCDGDEARQAAFDLELDRQLKGGKVMPDDAVACDTNEIPF